ncbi:MAG: NUDIX hydrolase [Pseudomonadota bacterium]
MIRRFGARPQTSRKYRQRTGAYAVLPRHGKLLLTLQRMPEPDLQLPGGGIDPGESPIQALHREVLEETGWRIGQPRRLGAFRRFTFMPEYDLWAEKLCVVFFARPIFQIMAPTEPDHETVWLPPDVAVESLGNDGDRHFAAWIR